MSYERSSGPGIGDDGIGAVQLLPNVAGHLVTIPGQADSGGSSSSGGSGLRTVLVLGALGVGGYFLYRHFKKKSGHSSTP